MRFIPPAWFIAVSGSLLCFACANSSVIEGQNAGGNSGGGGAVSLNPDASTISLKTDGPSIRLGSDAPPAPGCGNGILTKDEACDDGNNVSGDGCAANCLSVEPGFSCATPGQPCRPIARCGDGVVVFPEQCDDGNKTAGDGCSDLCKVEIGFKCTVGISSQNPSVCTPTTCGDGKKEGAEACDDGNDMPFDGCSSDCQNEPSCKTAGPCTSTCGDGIVLNEECDDGNNTDGDGCSSDCKIETGFTCSQPTLGNKMLVPVIYRDFKFQNPTDFEAGVTGQTTASTGMVQNDLDVDGKPVFTGITGGAIHVAGQNTFSEWYRNTAGVNDPTPSKLALWNNGQGAYVNRYGANGEQWQITEIAYYCGNVGAESTDATGNIIPCTSKYGSTDCDKEVAAGKVMVPGSCTISNGSYTARFVVSSVDGNPLFFPVDSDTFSPASQLSGAQIPPLYDATASWPWDLDAAGNKRLHNFSFTSEVRYWFKYQAGQSYELDFTGDDDVWLFVNKKLAVDLGGIHTPVSGSVTLDATAAAKFGLTDGNVYEAAVFQAERQTTGSLTNSP